MTRVITWEGVEYLVVTKVFCNIALAEQGTDLNWLCQSWCLYPYRPLVKVLLRTPIKDQLFMFIQNMVAIKPGYLLGVDSKRWWSRGKLPVFTLQGTVVVAVVLYMAPTSLHKFHPKPKLQDVQWAKKHMCLIVAMCSCHHCLYELVCEWGSNKYIYHCLFTICPISGTPPSSLGCLPGYTFVPPSTT